MDLSWCLVCDRHCLEDNVSTQKKNGDGVVQKKNKL